MHVISLECSFFSRKKYSYIYQYQSEATNNIPTRLQQRILDANYLLPYVLLPKIVTTQPRHVTVYRKLLRVKNCRRYILWTQKAITCRNDKALWVIIKSKKRIKHYRVAQKNQYKIIKISY